MLKLFLSLIFSNCVSFTQKIYTFVKLINQLDDEKVWYSHLLSHFYDGTPPARLGSEVAVGKG